MPHTDPPPSGQPDPERAERIHAQLTAPGAPFAVVRGERGTLEYADGPRTLREFVETTWAFGDTPFLIAGERRYSYGEFFAAASALAVRLNERYGLRPGDRAVVAMRNLPEWQIAFWAAQLAGLIAVPLNAWWTEDEFTYALDDCEPGVLLVERHRHPQPLLDGGLGAVVEPAVGAGREPVGGLREELREPVRRRFRGLRVREVDHQVQGPDLAGGAGVAGRGRHALRHLDAHGSRDPAGGERRVLGGGRRARRGPSGPRKRGARRRHGGYDQGRRSGQSDGAAVTAYPVAGLLHRGAFGVRGSRPTRTALWRSACAGRSGGARWVRRSEVFRRRDV
ncbi:hypothetical protein SMICM304S_09026 [Streptomyces microflavus]